MILIFGGTTEGRIAVELLEEAGKPYYYSTKNSSQQVTCIHGIRLTGALDRDDMENLCRGEKIELIIDAAHPFAQQLRLTIEEVSNLLSIPVIRLERKYPKPDSRFIWCSDINDAIQALQRENITHLLALTGVNTIKPLYPFWKNHLCHFRILDRDDSRRIAAQNGFPKENLIYFYEGENEEEILHMIHPDAILTKESGESGFFREKTEAAIRCDIKVFVIRRPSLPSKFYRVYGKEGLRKYVERFAPGFFPLRSGFTTGTCATAAVKSAMTSLLSGIKIKEVEIELPSGEAVTLPVSNNEIHEEYAISTVIKQSGDDPDVTNEAKIYAEVRQDRHILNLPYVKLNDENDLSILLYGGKGVGRITLPGLGLGIGEPAINQTPRKMIMEAIQECLSEYDCKDRIWTVIISVENGEELAKQTFNPKLGVIDGISIIGTSGIVRPFSHEAFVASIRKEMEVAKAMGAKHIVINSGAKSERILMKQYPELLPQAFIHYGNYIGETLKITESLKIPHVTLGIMIGKAVKLAEGALDTHSRSVVMNKEFIYKLGQEAELKDEELSQMEGITLARELWNLFPYEKYPLFYKVIIKNCYDVCQPLFQYGTLTVCLLDEKENIYF